MSSLVFFVTGSKDVVASPPVWAWDQPYYVRTGSRRATSQTPHGIPVTRKTTQTPTFPTPYAPRNCNNKTTFLRYTRACNSPNHSAHTHLRGATETHLVDVVVGLHNDNYRFCLAIQRPGGVLPGTK